MTLRPHGQLVPELCPELGLCYLQLWGPQWAGGGGGSGGGVCGGGNGPPSPVCIYAHVRACMPGKPGGWRPFFPASCRKACRGRLAYPARARLTYLLGFLCRLNLYRKVSSSRPNEVVRACRRAQAGCSKFGREWGEDLGKAGVHVMSPLASQGWEGHLPSPACQSPPDQVTPSWAQARFLMGVVSQLLCFIPELLEVWPVEH